MEKYDGARNFDDFKKFITDMKAAHKERLENEEGRIPDAVESSVSFLFLIFITIL